MAAYGIKQSDLDNAAAAHATMLINNVPAKVGDTVEYGMYIKYLADVGYIFYKQSDPLSGISLSTTTLTYGTTVKYFNISTAADSALLTYNTGYREDLVFVVKTKVDPNAAPQNYKITQQDLDYFTDNNASLEINDSAAVVGSDVIEGDELKFTADSGETNWKFFLKPDPFSGIKFPSVKVVNRVNNNDVNFGELSEDFKTATLIFSFDSDVDFAFIIETEQIFEEPPEETEDDGSIFEVTQDIINTVNANRITNPSGELIIDYSNYMVRLFSIPFDVPDEFVGSVAPIYLGSHNTTAQAPRVLRNEFEINIGNISVPLESNNLMDFKNTTCILHLPYAAPIVLDSNYVVGETIKITYVVACNTGVATINVYSTKTERVITTVNVLVGSDIPYGSATNQSVDNYDISLGGDNGVRTAFIELARNNSELNNNYFSIPILDDGVLESRTGYFKVEDLDLVSSATRNEKDDIIQMLKSGVKIK